MLYKMTDRYHGAGDVVFARINLVVLSYILLLIKAVDRARIACLERIRKVQKVADYLGVPIEDLLREGHEDGEEVRGA